MEATFELLRAARALLGMTNVYLAEHAGVSKRSLVRIEAGETVRPEIRHRVQSVFERHGIEFMGETEECGAGIRFRSPKGKG